MTTWIRLEIFEQQDDGEETPRVELINEPHWRIYLARITAEATGETALYVGSTKRKLARYLSKHFTPQGKRALTGARSVTATSKWLESRGLTFDDVTIELVELEAGWGDRRKRFEREQYWIDHTVGAINIQRAISEAAA